MGKPRVRPEFEQPFAAEPVAFFAALAAAMADPASDCRGRTFAGGAILRLRDAEQRVWSPALYVSIEPGAGGVAHLHGRFSPSSPVWTAFVAIYLTLVCLGLGALCWGGAQWVMKEPPWALLGVPVAALLAALTHGAAYVGQGLGADDMYRLRAFVERVAGAVAAGRG